MKHTTIILAAIILAAPVQPARAQMPPPPLNSPEVHPDRTVTFRFRDPNAREVSIFLETGQHWAMQKDAEGVWSATTEALEPDYYGYSFVADGVSLLDPSNWRRKPNFLWPSNEVHVPGPSSLTWETNDVPHGVVHHHFYHSGVVGDNRDFYVYTPPNYDGHAKTPYPVFYLLHGYSDDASGWTAVGRANIIMDNLIAQGKAKPMLVVMTLGYGAPEILTGFGAFPKYRLPNMQKFREALLTEVMPQVEKAYRVSTNRNQRAIAGLSMGGAESLYTGLNNLDKFSWIGAFSSGGLAEDFDADFPSVNPNALPPIHLLWIACGTDDRLIGPNRKLRAWLDTKGVKHVDIETPGAHTWMVWRRNLSNFAPLLFQNSGQ